MCSPFLFQEHGLDHIPYFKIQLRKIIIIIPYLFSDRLVRNTLKGALHSVADTRTQVPPLDLYQCRYSVILSEGQTERKPPAGREKESEYRWRTMRISLISNRQPGSLMCPVYNIDTQLPGTFNQIRIRYTRSYIAVNTTKQISEMASAQARNRTRDLCIDSPACYH